jgi:hypothetical protein
MNNSKIFLVTILSITTIFLATSTFTPLASAQYDNQGQGQDNQGQGPPGQGYQGQGGPGGQGFRGQHQFQGTRTAVSGTYTNSNLGVQITLPDGWSGFEMKQPSGNARVMIAPGGIQTTQGTPRLAVTIGISLMSANSQTPQMMPRNMQGITCTNSTTTNTVSSLNLNVVIRDCSGTDQNGNAIEMKSKTETGQINNANVVFSLRANPASGFDSNVAAFDSMISTLQISTPTTTPSTTNPTAPTPITTPPGAPAAIPNWVKGIFGMYAQGQLSDNDLVQALQFLIKQGIIHVQ